MQKVLKKVRKMKTIILDLDLDFWLAVWACLGWPGWLSWPEWLLTGLDDKVLQDFAQSCARD